MSPLVECGFTKADVRAGRRSARSRRSGTSPPPPASRAAFPTAPRSRASGSRRSAASRPSSKRSASVRCASASTTSSRGVELGARRARRARSTQRVRDAIVAAGQAARLSLRDARSRRLPHGQPQRGPRRQIAAHRVARSHARVGSSISRETGFGVAQSSEFRAQRPRSSVQLHGGSTGSTRRSAATSVAGGSGRCPASDARKNSPPVALRDRSQARLVGARIGPLVASSFAREIAARRGAGSDPDTRAL